MIPGIRLYLLISAFLFFANKLIKRKEGILCQALCDFGLGKNSVFIYIVMIFKHIEKRQMIGVGEIPITGLPYPYQS